MANWVVVLSGPIRSGKTTLASRLSDKFGMTLVKTHDLIQDSYKNRPAKGRIELQEYGERLDKETKGQWVASELAKVVVSKGENATFVVDSARIPEQVAAIRRAFPRVTHIHLTATDNILRTRYDKRAAMEHDPVKYAEAKKNATERGVERLAGIADIVIDTELCTADDVFVRATSRMSLYKNNSGLVDVVVGGQFGSEGKGQIVNYLAREYDYIVRVGGPNAGHTVTEAEGAPYIYHQVPSGARTNSAHNVLGPGMVVNVTKLLKEISECELGVEHLSIDPHVMTISQTDIDSEEGLFQRIGSTKQGVGAATARRITDRGLESVVIAKKVPELAPFIKPTYEVLFDALSRNKRVLIEGTQGTGLSLYHGEYPFVTSRETTVSGCISEVGIAPKRVRRVIMVCRTYPIRVESPPGGSSGPLRDISWKVVSRRSGIPAKELEALEHTSTTNRKRRVGEFDWSLLRKAAFLNGPTDIALTFADYLSKDNADAIRFEQLHDTTIEFIEEVERVSGAPVSLITTGRGDRHVIDRRSW